MAGRLTATEFRPGCPLFGPSQKAPGGTDDVRSSVESGLRVCAYRSPEVTDSVEKVFFD
jgi:hypothetical protein